MAGLTAAARERMEALADHGDAAWFSAAHDRDGWRRIESWWSLVHAISELGWSWVPTSVRANTHHLVSPRGFRWEVKERKASYGPWIHMRQVARPSPADRQDACPTVNPCRSVDQAQPALTE